MVTKQRVLVVGATGYLGKFVERNLRAMDIGLERSVGILGKSSR
ncbi:MAG: hypothetical protein ACQ9MH_26075 [Nitrospinales bacterium]